MELYKELNSIAEKCKHDYTNISINLNVQAKPHIDKNNVGESMIIGFGNYEGGQLCLNTGPQNSSTDVTWNSQITSPLPSSSPSPLSSESQFHSFDIKHKPLLFNGKQLHWTLPFINDRFSIIYYTHNDPFKLFYIS